MPTAVLPCNHRINLRGAKKRTSAWHCPECGKTWSQGDLFDDPSGRGDGWRAKDTKASEWDETLAKHAGMTMERYLEDRQGKRARGLRWLKRLSARADRYIANK